MSKPSATDEQRHPAQNARGAEASTCNAPSPFALAGRCKTRSGCGAAPSRTGMRHNITPFGRAWRLSLRCNSTPATVIVTVAPQALGCVPRHAIAIERALMEPRGDGGVRAAHRLARRRDRRRGNGDGRREMHSQPWASTPLAKLRRAIPGKPSRSTRRAIARRPASSAHAPRRPAEPPRHQPPDTMRPRSNAEPHVVRRWARSHAHDQQNSRDPRRSLGR